MYVGSSCSDKHVLLNCTACFALISFLSVLSIFLTICLSCSGRRKMRSPIVVVMYKTNIKIYFDVSVTFTIIRRKKEKKTNGKSRV